LDRHWPTPENAENFELNVKRNRLIDTAMEFLDKDLRKDSSLLLRAIHSLFNWTGSFSGFCLSLGYRIPCGLFTPGSFYPVVFANGLVLKNLAKWRDFHYSQIFSQTVTFRGFYI
jgi:hypothetical protein